MIRIQKLSPTFLISKEGVENLSPVVRDFFEGSCIHLAKNDDVKCNGKNCIDVVKIAMHEANCGFLANVLGVKQYIILLNENQKIVAMCEDGVNIHLLDEVFDDFDVISETMVDPEGKLFIYKLLLKKGKDWYLLSDTNLICLGRWTTQYIFYNKVEKKLFFIDDGLKVFDEVENFRLGFTKYPTVEFESRKELYKKIYRHNEWVTPLFWRLKRWLNNKNQ